MRATHHPAGTATQRVRALRDPGRRQDGHRAARRRARLRASSRRYAPANDPKYVRRRDRARRPRRRRRRARRRSTSTPRSSRPEAEPRHRRGRVDSRTSSVLMPGERVRARELRRTRPRQRCSAACAGSTGCCCSRSRASPRSGSTCIGTGAGGDAVRASSQEIYLALGAVGAVRALVHRRRALPALRVAALPRHDRRSSRSSSLLGFSTRGSRRWIQLPFFQFQPSELGKLTLLLALAAFIARNARPHRARCASCSCASPTSALPAGARVPRARLRHGARVRRRRSSACSSSRACACATSRCSAASRRCSRWLVLWALPAGGVRGAQAVPGRSPDLVPAPRPQHARRGLQPVPGARSRSARAGSSGAASPAPTQTLNDFLPERRTDFVFAVLGEERGFVGAMLLLGLYLVVLWRVLRAIAVARTLYARLICAGIVRLAAGVRLHQRRHDDRHRAGHRHPAAAALGRRFEHDHRARRDRRGAVDPAARAPAAAPAAAIARTRAAILPEVATASGTVRSYCEVLMTILQPCPLPRHASSVRGAHRWERPRTARTRALTTTFIPRRARSSRVRAAAGYGESHDPCQAHADQRRPARSAGRDRRRRQAL